jgi:hypothetical protein
MPGERPRQRPDLNSRAIDGETLILDRTTNQIHQLNVTATFVWRRCDGKHASAEVADELAATFGVDPDTARDAVRTTLRRLDELGLLDTTPD